MSKGATDDNAQEAVNILASVLNRINYLSCLIIDSKETYQEMCMVLQEANLEVSEAFVPLCMHDDDAQLRAKLSVIQNSKLLHILIDPIIIIVVITVQYSILSIAEQ